MPQDFNAETVATEDAGENSGWKRPRYLVGIGASAGGLESLELFFRKVPPDTGMAFIIIQHLSPDFKSMMYELLARDTIMPIHVVEDGMLVEANSIYLLPPRKEMIIADGRLHLTDKDLTRGLTLPIDHFFESLAREAGKHAIGIILSGSGSDGTRGIAHIHREGGLVISESLETAKFDGMPASAQASGFVDLILPPGDIGKELLNFADNPLASRKKKLPSEDGGNHLHGLDSIFQQFRTTYEIDFSVYKETTVMRRIYRRMTMAGAENLDQYAEKIATNPAELDLLYSDLLIGVTQFFRDAEIFELLIQTVFPRILRQDTREMGIRAWVAGCATGEEAYSLAIAWQEAMLATNCVVPLKIFATDVHKKSLEHASRGFFRPEVLRGIPTDYLRKYFLPRADGYQVTADLRKLIVFAPHNVLRDAPFTDLDFVSCRNLLIYFQPAAQSRAISLFHYGLRVGGELLLGGSESPGELSGEFEVLNDRARLYRKIRDVRLAHNLRAPVTSALGVVQQVQQRRSRAMGSRMSHGLAPIYDELLQLYIPPSLLIDESRALIDTFGGAEKFLRFPSRQPTLDVLDLIPREIRTTLSGALQRAIKDRGSVRFGNIGIPGDDGPQNFNLTVAPLKQSGGQDRYFLISFEPVQVLPLAAPAMEAAPAELDASRDQIRQLESDLRFSQENLQATVEELETSNEELQATNEELIASNEELQSTNEELHSLNEELYTVNAEHQRKNEELAELNRDMHHLLENTDVATVFLDRELRIRRFTSRVHSIFELMERDIGRPIHTFSSKIRLDNLDQRLQDVLRTGEPYESETTSDNGTMYLMRLLPYFSRDQVDGIVLMWVDVSSLEMLRGKLRWLSAIVESTDDAIIGHALDGSITSWNAGAERLYGYTAAEMIGQPITLLVPVDRQGEIPANQAKILNGERVLAIDTVRVHKSGQLVQVSVTISPVVDAANKVIGISKIARDIGPRIAMEREIRNQVRQREQFLAMLSHELRNPLNAILNASQLLRDQRTPDAMRGDAVSTITRQVSIMRDLLLDLLDVARISENRINLNFKLVDLRGLRDIVRETVEPQLRQHASELFFDTPSEPLLVRGDATRLIQVMVNLIHNAAKYSRHAAPIRVVLRREAEWVHMAVIDQGVGIPHDKLDCIFEPFIQLTESRGSSEGGLGVGLTLVKTLVESHGGKVRAESPGAGLGCTFHVWLPAVAESGNGEVAADNALSVHQPHLGNLDSAHISLRSPGQPLKILIVEDIEDNRKMLQALLELDGHQVLAAATGEQALVQLQTWQPQVALVDIGLPGMNGHEVARHIRQNAAFAGIHLIALTGFGQAGDIEQALQAGFDAHLVKPITVDHLRKILAERWTQRKPPAPLAATR
ncbi:MAG: chemotaxis protein CheB [Pirellulales bacterium]|nr:chemotaxis protein CheB [Pirellulales bacterium]